MIVSRCLLKVQTECKTDIYQGEEDMSDEPVSPMPPAEEQPTMQSYTPEPAPAAYTPEPIPPAAPPEKKKTNTWLIVLIVVLVVLCCCCLLSGILAWNFGDMIIQNMGITY
jgi:hypothetical protein